MIESFKSRETEKLFNRERSHKLPPEIQKTALRKLWMLDAAMTLNELKVPPNNQLEALKGERKGQHSIRINRQWRIHDGQARNVEIVDYH